MAEGITEAQFFVELERYDKVRRGFRSFRNESAHPLVRIT